MFRRSAAAFALVAVVVGCGGSNDPAGAANQFIATIQASGYLAAGAVMCAEQRDAFTSQLQALAALSPGVDLNQVNNALHVTFANPVITTTSTSANSAVVHVAADVTLAADVTKLQQLLGSDAPDVLPTTTKHIDNDWNVTNENGTWKVCSPPDAMLSGL
jgi:multidrug efflux pump subunit AcrB